MSQSSVGNEIIRLKIENIFLRAKLASLEKELQKFVSSYIKSVSDLYDELTSIQRQIDSYKNKISASYIAPKLAEEEPGYDSELKKLHRRLVKITHPDVSGARHAAELTRAINEAYNARNLAELMRVEQRLMPAVSTEAYHRLLTTNYDLKADLEMVKNRPEYRLRESLDNEEDREAAILGIRLKLKRRITDENRHLLSLKLEYLEKMQRQIVA
jgi:hypothetical protein